MKIKSTFFLLLLFVFTEQLIAQTGKEFWFVAPEASSGHRDRPIALRISCLDTAANIVISVPASPGLFNGGSPINISLAANTATSVDLTANIDLLETKPANTILNNGLLVTSNHLISVYYDVDVPNAPTQPLNGEIFALKGESALGTEFYTPFQNLWDNGNYTPTPYSSFDIVATQDNTEIFIYPKTAIVGRPALQKFRIVLNRGQTWSGANPTRIGANNPSGTIITSDKPIAVTVKTDSDAALPGKGGCRDLGGDQIVPTDIIGKEYIIVKGNVEDESAFILATQNNTVITIDGVYETTLFGSETYRVPINNQFTYIKASKPVYTVHYSGFGCELGSAILPPLNCAGSSQVSFVRGTAEFFGLNLLVKAGNQDKFVLNGSTTLINPAAFTVVPGTGGQWVGAVISFNTTNIPVGTANILRNTGEIFAMGLINGGATTTCRYGYFSEFKAAINISAGPDQFVCKNNTVKLLGKVSGGTTTGEWTTNGSGTFTPSPTALNATYIPSLSDLALGSIEFTLTSTGQCFPVTDKMIVNFTAAPTIDAGNNQTVCANNPSVNLSSTVTLAAGGVWSGGSGIFSPNNTSLSTNYTPSIAEITAGQTKLIITSTGNGDCIPVKDSIIITITPRPTVNAGTDQSKCANNANSALNGAFTIATGAQWSGGLGGFNPSNTVMNAVYTPTPSEIASGTLILTLTTTGNGLCNAVNDQVTINFTQAPTVVTGANQILCANKAQATLSATISSPATGGIWSGGLGTFNPSNTTLNATYTPSSAEILSGNTNLTLTSTGNGNCSAVANSLNISYTASPTINAGIDQSVCANNPAVNLSGQILTIATGGIWSGGTGTFNPNNTTLNATYTPSAAEITAGFVNLTLTSTGNGNCNAVSDQLTITITSSPIVNAGNNLTSCVNNANVTLSGFIQNAGGGQWSGGGGSFSPSTSVLNASYIPTPTDLSNGFVDLTLSSVGNGKCNAVTDVVRIIYNPAPTVNAGVNQSYCANKPAIQLNGSVTIATGGQWSGGLGTFTPNNNTLNAVYNPTTSEILSGVINLTLTSTGNGQCNPVSNSVQFQFTQGPEANAGADQTICANNPNVTLNGSVTIASGGIWSSTGGGFFTPAASSLNTTYTPSLTEINSGKFKITLTTSGNNNCNPVIDEIEVTVSPAPIVNAGADLISCANKPTVTLNGLIQNAGGGQWTGGAGLFSPASNILNSTYTPSSSEIAAGSVTLTLTSTGNGNCIASSDQVKIVINPSPIVNAGTDQTLCSNNAIANLNGIISIATGGQWSGGLGNFNPNNNSLNATYSPSNSEISNGFVILTLTSTGNGVCNAETDQIRINFTAPTEANAGFDQTVCANNATISLNGTIAVASGGIWSGGTGTFTPNNTGLNASYLPSPTEINAGTVTLTLTTTGNNNCKPATDNVTFTITPAPIVNAGIDLSSCFNNPSVNLNGSVQNAGGASWSGGTGVFNPSSASLISSYIPSFAEITAGSVILSLTSTNNGNCIAVSDQVKITINPAPTVNAGNDITACANNPSINLNGSITLASSGSWSGGLGLFNPSNSSLATSYTPTANEIANGSVTLTLTSVGNGTCNPVSDQITITYTPAPQANAGLNKTVCANNPSITLIGSVSIASGGIWSGGLGIFIPDNNTLNTIYTPTATEISKGSLKLTLTTTGNGNCLPVSDDIEINITPAPIVNAGSDLVSCVNNPSVILNGSVTNATGALWSGGNGIFTPSANVLNATYVPTATEIANGSITLTLSSTGNGNCNPVIDQLTVTITPAPTANAGSDISVCANNSDVVLNGSINLASGGVWSGGLGVFKQGVNSLSNIYTPTQSEINSGSLTLTLTSSGNGNCSPVSDNVIISFTNSPSVSVGSKQTLCVNNPLASLSGAISIASGGIWSGGSGTFSPNNTSLNATYLPTQAEISSGLVTLTLTSTGNLNCKAESNSLDIAYTPAAFVNAGADKTICVNDLSADLNGFVSGKTTTGRWSSSGTGIFLPNANLLNATYKPSQADSLNKSVLLTLSSTNNGNCNTVTDTLEIFILPAGIANAGADQSVCANNSATLLSGLVSGGASAGVWTTSGNGTFVPNNKTLNASYLPSKSDTTDGSVTLTLTANSCNNAFDQMVLTITPAPKVGAGIDQIVCLNELNIQLAGNVFGGSSTGIWSSSGTGNFLPSATNLNAQYRASKADSASNGVTIVLTSTNNGNCLAVKDTMKIRITTSGIANAGIDQILCNNNALVQLNGNVGGGADAGVWSSNGTGVFLPSTINLGATYSPSETDLKSGFILITLTGNSCDLAKDEMRVTFTSSPKINAGANRTVCSNNADVELSALIDGASGINWATSGDGIFLLNNNSSNNTYRPSDNDKNTGIVFLFATTTGNDNCKPVTDTVKITINPKPTIDAGKDQLVCSNSQNTLLNASIIGGSGKAKWVSQGTGAFFPSDTSLTATYNFSKADSIIGSVKLTITTTNNGNCLAETDDLTIRFGNSTFADAGKDIVICANQKETNISGFVTGGSSTGIWESLGTGNFFPNNASLKSTYRLSKSDSTSGQVKLVLTSTNNGECLAGRDTMIIFIENSPIIDAGSDKNICIGAKSILINGSSNTASTTWSTKGSGFFFPSPNNLTTEYYFSKEDSLNGSVTILLSSSKSNCPTKDSLLITFGTKNLADAGKDFSTCTASDGIQLNGIVGGTTTSGRWSKLEGNGIFLPSDTTLKAVYAITPTDSSRGHITLVLNTRNDGLCLPSKDTIKISFKRLPSIKIGSDKALCRGASSVTLSPEIKNLKGIKWKTLGSGTFLPNDTTIAASYNIGRADSLNGEVLLIVNSRDDEACLQLSDTMKIIVKNPIIPGFKVSAPCAKQRISFSDTSEVIVGSIRSRKWDFGDNSSSNLASPSHIFDIDQTYQVKLTIESNLGCKDSVVKAISVKLSPVADFTTNEEQLVINKEVSFIDLSKGANAWAWNFGSNLDTVKIQNPKNTFFTEATYEVALVVSNQFFCRDTVIKQIPIKGAIVLPPQLPNAFSPSDNPSNTGVNDVFYPRGGPFQSTSYDFKVYNIWGEIVFESDNPEKGWDGYYKNKLQPVGSYIYTLKAKTADGKEYIRTGDVSIIR
ncbi:MAG: hypothetical protein EAZ07_01310 [Cytophagales bacterium]|nr:MAG: hypothetical protein EAZ07_01310 [Cytophagales bacterium]